MPFADWVADTARVEGAGARGAAWTKTDLAYHVAVSAQGMARHLPARTVVGLIADNSPQWIAIDLAAQAADMILVPCPGFFTREQLAHATGACGMQALFCADAGLAASLGFANEVFDLDGLRLFRARPRAQRIPDARDAQKITFTSGSTGEPKGVVLSTAQQLRTARGLADAIVALGISRHLCALPLPVLLENVAGAWTALTIGAACICPPLADVGLSGSSAFDAERCLDAIARWEPDSLIVLPQMLHLLVNRLASSTGNDMRIRSLKFVAVGGAKTPAPLIVRARDLGLPVYEGYGLTECASVVSVNVPGADRAGTVGRPLQGVKVRAAPDGELEIAGRSGAGYLGSVTSAPEPWLRTGDLGAIDADGYVSITGRRKNVLVTSFGRNVSPEWPESLLLENPLLAQAVVFGEARPALVAVLVPSSARADDAALNALVAAANARLPDYARIRDWIRAAEPFTAGNELATANGRVRRDAIARRYARELDALYTHTGIA